jgi:hypothetical protein
MEKSLTMKFLILVCLWHQDAFAQTLTPLKITFMEALAPQDTTSSERFQKEYEYAIQTAKDLTKAKLEKCGYKINDDKVFYDASDTLQALEKAKIAQNNGAWLIVGPRRSNHYLLAAKGADSTPTVSIMASAKEVYELSPLHLTLGQSNQNMAVTLAKETKVKFKNRKEITYVSIVSEDCVTCLDFAKSYLKAANKLGLKNIKEVKITGEQPDISTLENLVKENKPDVVLIPNYSKVSSYLIGIINRWNPNTLFAGGDGWGDNKYGFVHHSPQLESANGITVKGFPPADKGLAYFSIGKEILKNPSIAAAFPTSGSAQALLKVIEATVDLVCKSRPKNKLEFAKQFQQQGKKHYFNPWGVSVFKLVSGEVVFDKTVR